MCSMFEQRYGRFPSNDRNEFSPREKIFYVRKENMVGAVACPIRCPFIDIFIENMYLDGRICATINGTERVRQFVIWPSYVYDRIDSSRCC